MSVYVKGLGKSVSVRTIATGNGLHVDLDETGNISLVLWGISPSFDDDVTIFEAKLTPEQEHRILHAETVDAWTVEPIMHQQCAVVQ